MGLRGTESGATAGLRPVKLFRVTEAEAKSDGTAAAVRSSERSCQGGTPSRACFDLFPGASLLGGQACARRQRVSSAGAVNAGCPGWGDRAGLSRASDQEAAGRGQPRRTDPCSSRPRGPRCSTSGRCPTRQPGPPSLASVEAEMSPGCSPRFGGAQRGTGSDRARAWCPGAGFSGRLHTPLHPHPPTTTTVPHKTLCSGPEARMRTPGLSSRNAWREGVCV